VRKKLDIFAGQIYIDGMANGTINQKIIADRLNISVGTVSRALRNNPYISEETRSKVEKVARQLGYNSGKSRNGSGKSRYIGVLIHSPTLDWHKNAYMDYLEGMSSICSSLNVSLVSHHVEASSCEQILDPQYQPPSMREGEIDGLIMVFRWPPEIVRKLAEKFTCVSIFHEVPQGRCSLVGISTRSGMQAIASKIVSVGHKKIGYLGFSGNISWARELSGAYYEAIASKNIEYDPRTVISLPVETLNSDHPVLEADVLNRIVAGIESGTCAWICAGDRVGYSLYRELLNRGYRIPDDVSISGFNNVECPVPEGFKQLTSVTVPSRQMGTEALRLLLEQMDTPESIEKTVRFNCDLVEGETVGKIVL
jgi:LacI family transcriptional regulator